MGRINKAFILLLSICIYTNTYSQISLVIENAFHSRFTQHLGSANYHIMLGGAEYELQRNSFSGLIGLNNRLKSSNGTSLSYNVRYGFDFLRNENHSCNALVTFLHIMNSKETYFAVFDAPPYGGGLETEKANIYSLGFGLSYYYSIKKIKIGLTCCAGPSWGTYLNYDNRILKAGTGQMLHCSILLKAPLFK